MDPNRSNSEHFPIKNITINLTVWPKYQTRRKCTKCSHEGQGGHRRVHSRFQLNTTRLEGENTILLLDPTVQLWTFSYQKYHQNFTFWPKYQTSRKCTKCSHEGQGGHRRVPSRFQLNTTRLEVENIRLSFQTLTVQLWTFSNKKYHKNFTFWPKNQTSWKCTKCSHEGQGGHRRVPSRFQLNTTRLEGENTPFSFKTLTVQLWTFSYQKYHQNFTFWDMRGKGVTGESPADFSSIPGGRKPSNSEHFAMKNITKISHFGQKIKRDENAPNVPMRGKGVTGVSSEDFSSIQQNWR